MRATVREVGSVSVIDLYGKITIGRGDVVLREHVGRLLRQGRRRILINLEGVSYMDSCGLGELAACYRNARDHSATLKLLNPTGRVFDLLQMIKLEEVIESFGDESEALVAFGREEAPPIERNPLPPRDDGALGLPGR